jgi:DsbC/DsbD-like thiol-disulfide interchange protein
MSRRTRPSPSRSALGRSAFGRSALAALALAAGLFPAAARAERAILPEDLVSIEVLPGWRTVAGTLMAGLRITLAPGWKTYWRAPGTAGIPPLFDWTGSANVSAAAFHWPVPEVFDRNGIMSIGYAGQVVIPVEVTTANPGQPVRLAGTVELGVCHDICVPVELRFDKTIPAEGRRDSAIAAALVDRPLTAEEAGVSRIACRIAPTGSGLRLTAEIDLPPTGLPEVVVVETADPGIRVSEAETRRDGGRLTAVADLAGPGGGGFALDRSGIRLTVLGTDSAVDILGCPAG